MSPKPIVPVSPFIFFFNVFQYSTECREALTLAGTWARNKWCEYWYESLSCKFTEQAKYTFNLKQ